MRACVEMEGSRVGRRTGKEEAGKGGVETGQEGMGTGQEGAGTGQEGAAKEVVMDYKGGGVDRKRGKGLEIHLPHRYLKAV